MGSRSRKYPRDLGGDDRVTLAGDEGRRRSAPAALWQPGTHPQHAGEVEGILAAYGATDIPGASTSAGQSTRRSPDEVVRLEQGARVELLEEELQPLTRVVTAGEVVIRKQVRYETVTLKVPVEREELVIERLPLEPRPADESSELSKDPLTRALSDRLRAMQPGETVRIPVVEEEVIVHKQPVVRSEVVIGKRLVRDIQQFSDTVRREVADIDTDGQVRVADQEDKS